MNGTGGMGTVGGINMSDINQYFTATGDDPSRPNANRAGSQAQANGKVGSYQYRNAQNQQIKFGGKQGSQSNPPGATSGSRKAGADAGANGQFGGFMGPGNSIAPTQNQLMLNRTGPIKIQNRLQAGPTKNDFAGTGNNSQNQLNISGYSTSGGNAAAPGTNKGGNNKFNDSMNISDAQGSIQNGDNRKNFGPS